jgi:dTDP-4-amino-4,6-dideoxygalactose transaminase
MPTHPNTTLSIPSDQDTSGRTLGTQELAALREAIESGTLTSTKGRFTKEFEGRFAQTLGVRSAYACSSGTAAIHTAIAAIDPEPGDEIITTAITDMGALTPILYQGAIPVFADVDPHSYNITAASITAKLSEKTRAIIVTHLFGHPCDMPAIRALAAERGLPIIEDCAQSFLGKSQGKLLGTCGSIGCFSLQQGKHITTGEGGVVATDDPHLARRVFLYINKAWGYGDPTPDHYFLALNYRMSELQGAVALAQLEKLERVVQVRIELASRMDARLEGTPGIELPWHGREGDTHVFWKYCLGVDSQVIPGGSPALGKYLRERGIACAPRYIQKPAFQCEVFREQRTFGKSRFPFTLARPEAVDYSPGIFPGTFAALDRVLVLPLNEKYTDDHIDHITSSIKAGVATLNGGHGK